CAIGLIPADAEKPPCFRDGVGFSLRGAHLPSVPFRLPNIPPDTVMFFGQVDNCCIGQLYEIPNRDARGENVPDADAPGEGRRRGRRPKDEKRIPVSLRVTPALRSRLASMAEENGRSLTQQLE